MTELPSTPGQRNRPSRVSRRGVLAGVATVAVAGTAGCTAIVNELAARALEDVNLFNETGDPLSGSVEVVGPDGSTVLSESFDLEAQTGDEPNAEATATYADVWTATGTYEVAVELGDGAAVRGQSSAETAVTVEGPDEQMLGVAFGAEDEDAGILFGFGENWSDFHHASAGNRT